MRIQRMPAILLTATGLAIATAMVSFAAPSPDASEETPQVHYARVQLRLAQLGLKRVERMNRQVENAVSGPVVKEYRHDVEAATQLLRAAQAGGADAGFDYWLAHVQSAAKSYQLEWQNAQAANKRVPGAVDELDAQRTRLRAELFDILLAEGRQMAAKPPAERLAWQNQVLLTEMQQLHEEVFRNRRVGGGGYYYSPWWR